MFLNKMINYYDKILSKFKDGIKLIFANYIQLLVIAVVLFGIIWLGYTIRVIGSREISETLTVKFWQGWPSNFHTAGNSAFSRR